MNVVLVTDGYLPRLGGIELHVRDLGRRLAAEGHRVDVLTTTADGSLDLPGENPRSTGPTVHRLTPRRGPVPGTVSRTDLEPLLAGADVVHVHSSVVSPLAWQAADLACGLGVPSVVTVHSMLPHGTSVPVLLALRRATANGLHWTTVSDVVAAPLRRALDSPVSVLHNGIDPGPWARADGPRPTPDGGFTVVSALRFTARKRPRALVDVLARLRGLLPERTPLRAVLVGDGPLLPAVTDLVRARGMDGWVELRGRTDREELARTYAAADAYLAPARWESFGLAALEARCAGLPVVAMTGSGVAEFVAEGVEGFLADDDAHAARLLAHLATDPLVRQRIRHHNSTTPPGVTWDDVLPATLAHYALAGADPRATGRPTASDELSA